VSSVSTDDKTPKNMAALTRLAFGLTLMLLFGAVATKAVLIGANMEDVFVGLGSDSVLRLVMIRDWMGGQSWFDTTQYRMMPPEGVLIHWSRYLDALIGGLIAVFSSFVPIAKAEMLAVAVWPTLLQLGLIGLVGFGSKRLFGPMAACFAMLSVFTWPFTSQFYFRPGQIDHHNIQILMIVVMTLAAVWPARPAMSGLVAGIAAGFGLAIGLETLPYILLLGLLLFLRATLGLTSEANRLLGVFCLSFFGSAVVFWLGQTPAFRLGVPVCDQLGLPVLSLIAIASAASLVPMVIGLHGIWLRLALSIAIVAVGFVVVWPLLGGCVTGPYGDLPVDVQDIIRSSIREALPGVDFAKGSPGLYGRMMLPVAAAFVAAGALWLRIGRKTEADRRKRDIVGQLLVLSLVGIAASFSQVRLALMAAGAVPLLAGFALSAYLSAYLTRRSGVAAVKLMVTGLVVLSPSILTSTATQLLPNGLPSRGLLDRACRDRAAVAALDALPPAAILSPLNLSSLILLGTNHSVLSGPYHRSPAAFANGKIPFGLPDAKMQAYVDRTEADYVVVCEGSNYGDGLATALAEGGTAAWLRKVDLDAGPLLVFEVLSDDGT